MHPDVTTTIVHQITAERRAAASAARAARRPRPAGRPGRARRRSAVAAFALVTRAVR